MPAPGELSLLATSTFGLEAVVTRELHALGYEDAKPVQTGRVAFKGDARALVRANLHLRTSERVLVKLGEFPAADFGALFDGIAALPWEEWIKPTDAFIVSGRSVRSQLSSVPACQRIGKRAIAERLMRAHAVAELPETGPSVKIEVALLRDVATLTIDSSGAGLHKRGYRTLVGEAGLKETLAAGLVLLSNWRAGRALIDPFCGTGTIAIEAALIGRRIAPGIARGFDAELWDICPPSLWEQCRAEARAGAVEGLPVTIHASDVDEHALHLARQHARAAGVERDVHFARRDVAELSSKAKYGVIIANPPYGVRMGEEGEALRLHRALPKVFRGLPTWSFHVLTARLDLEEIFGQEATRRRKLYNAQVECTYFSFLGPKPPDMRRERVRDEDVDTPRETDADASAETGVGATTDGAVADATPRPAPRAEPAHDPDAPAFAGARERDIREIEQFASRLAKNVRHLRRYPSRGVTCYRVYERDCPDVPVIIDIYEDCVHVSEYERQHSRTAAQQSDWVDRVVGAISDATGAPPARVYFKEKHRQKGLSQHEKVGEEQDTLVVREGGLSFEVNLSDYIDTGLFLDHRLTRQMVREQAAGKRVLNLFCYTGSFTVYAASAGAASTVSVDLSNTYLSWAQRNLERNGVTAVLGELPAIMRNRAPHKLVRADVLEFLREHPEGPHYDLAIVDPPTFSNSKSTREDWIVDKSQPELFGLLARVMAPGGVVYFSTNYRRFKLDEHALQELGVQHREVSAQTVPPEYRNTRIHRCWRLVFAGAARP